MLPDPLDRLQSALTPSLSHPMGEGARRAGEGHGVFHPKDSSVRHGRFDPIEAVWLAGRVQILDRHCLAARGDAPPIAACRIIRLIYHR